MHKFLHKVPLSIDSGKTGRTGTGLFALKLYIPLEIIKKQIFELCNAITKLRRYASLQTTGKKPTVYWQHSNNVCDVNNIMSRVVGGKQKLKTKKCFS